VGREVASRKISRFARSHGYVAVDVTIHKLGEAPMEGQHEMVLNGVGAGGAEEWVCATCTRRILLRWPPDFELLVLDEGEANAVHVGGKGGAMVRADGVRPAPAPKAGARTPEVPECEVRWLRDNGIEWDGLSA
jgi:hypothetical protein